MNYASSSSAFKIRNVLRLKFIVRLVSNIQISKGNAFQVLMKLNTIYTFILFYNTYYRAKYSIEALGLEV